MIALDIETVAQSVKVLQSIMPEFEGRTGTKDPEKIAAQIAVKRAEWLDKAALDPNLGRIACVSLYDGSDMVSFHDHESKILSELWMMLEDQPEIVTFNGKSFDLPYIIRRSWYCGVKPTRGYDTHRYYSKTHFDLRLILADGDTHAKGKLSDYAKLKLGVDMDTKGSEVQALWDDGKIKEIVDHCEQDTLITWQLFESMRGYYL